MSNAEQAASLPFRTDQAADRGLSRYQLRGKAFESPFHGVHVKGAANDFVQRCRAALLILPAGAMFSDDTAVALMGLPLFAASQLVHVTAAAGMSQLRRRGVVGHVRDMRGQPTATYYGLPTTTPACTFLHLAARLPRSTLIGLGDAMLRMRLVTPVGLTHELSAHVGRRGSRQARDLLPLLSAAAESVMESALRLLLIDGGLPCPEINVNIYDWFGTHIARVDLLYRSQKVIVEYDGDQHRTSRQQFATDVERLSKLAAAGYLVLRFTAADVLGRPHYVLATVKATLASRAHA
jgi:very-short-patch-repair endonuclease